MPSKGPAEVFRPGEYILDELEARGWSQLELADILGRPAKFISELVSGLTSVTPETARGLAEAFGTSAEMWMNMQATFDLHAVHSKGEVARKAKLYSFGPIAEMTRRGWIEPSSNIEVLEKRVRKFFEMTDEDEAPAAVSGAARKRASSKSYSVPTTAEQAWLYRARHLAKALHVAPFAKTSLERALKQLRGMLANQEDVRLVPKVLAEAGIRFVIVKHLSGTMIDGYTFWLNNSPVIALSMRYGRIDYFWFTLLHEMEHVMKHETSLDVLLVGNDRIATGEKDESEQEADRFAASFSIDQMELETFINRVHPLYSSQKLLAFSTLHRVHPGILVGQLQFRGKIGYSHSRGMLVPVRDIITTSALTDGWGDQPPALS